jgi:hypothetical protein
MEGITFTKIKELEAEYERQLEKYSMIPCQLLGFPQVNEWMGRKTFQFVIKEIKFEPFL